MTDLTVPTIPRHQAIGVFDSGVGGLSVLQALRAAMPQERFVYLADSAHAPYGERGDAYVRSRTHAVTRHLREHWNVKALVVACNTATAAAVHELRGLHAGLPIVGLEPALKPALAVSKTRRIGVIGTRGTLGSAKFGALLQSLAGQAEFVVQPCDGLAHAIERSAGVPLVAAAAGGRQTCNDDTAALCAQYVAAMGDFGTAAGQMDALVLGCTHYVFAEPELRALVGPHVHIIESGAAVARQTQRVLAAAGLLLRTEPAAAERGPPCAAEALGKAPQHQLLTTGSVAMLQSAAHRWLNLPPQCCASAHVA